MVILAVIGGAAAVVLLGSVGWLCYLRLAQIPYGQMRRRRTRG